MQLHKKLLIAAAAISTGTTLFGAANENATLNASVTAGALEITAASVNGPWAPTSGAISTTGSAQVDAVTFEINGITVNDLNGDGLGWQLIATPGTLTFSSSTMTVGTTAGFNNPSDAGNTTINTANDMNYTVTGGAVGTTIDYDIAYTVPAFAEAGAYTGTIAFAVSAE